MPYLTYTEYKELGFVDIEQTEFDRLIKRASDVLDHVTSDFYVFNDLETDVAFRKNKFKKAVACQIEYFYEMDATNFHGLNEPSTVTIGRTTVSNSVRDSNSQTEQKNDIVSNDVYMYLSKTGLLYKGVGVI